MNEPATPPDAATTPAKAEAFSFGDPIPVTDGYDFLYTGCWMMGNSEWYEPPVDLTALAQTYRATAHHGSAIQVKRNILLRSFIPHPLLSRQAFSALATDYLVFGNFMWARCVSSADLVSNADPVYAWVERMLDIHDGLGRHAMRITDIDGAYR
jgi:capsid portal protein